jgi:hypothetical protein
MPPPWDLAHPEIKAAAKSMQEWNKSLICDFIFCHKTAGGESL